MAATLFLSATNVAQVAQHLTENVPHASTLYLNLTYPGRRAPEINQASSSPILQELQQAARQNSSITKLIISGGSVDAAALNTGHAALNQWYQSIIEALGQLSKLQVVKVQQIRVVTFAAVVGPGLTRLLPQATCLQSFQLDQVALERTTANQVIPQWGDALEKHGTLQELVVKECSLGGSHHRQDHQLEEEEEHCHTPYSRYSTPDLSHVSHNKHCTQAMASRISRQH